MMPSFSQVQQAAYYRWERRRGAHGRDRDDWLASEQDLLFAFNYELIAYYPLDAGPERFVGDATRRRCRFCELAAPHVSFERRRLAIPDFLGNHVLFANDQCDDCSATFAESFEQDLRVFARSLLDGGSAGLGGSAPPVSTNGTGNGHVQRHRLVTESFRPLAAFKGLTKLALSIMPERELPLFEDAVEWVVNADHDYDSPLFQGVRCYVHRPNAQGPLPSWAALARRVDGDAAVPYMLFFLGSRGATLQIAVPLCPLDDENDGKLLIVPRVCNPHAISQDVAPVDVNVISLASPEAAREVSLEPCPGNTP